MPGRRVPDRAWRSGRSLIHGACRHAVDDEHLLPLDARGRLVEAGGEEIRGRGGALRQIVRGTAYVSHMDQQLNNDITLLNGNTPAPLNLTWNKGEKWIGGKVPDWRIDQSFINPESKG